MDMRENVKAGGTVLGKALSVLAAVAAVLCILGVQMAVAADGAQSSSSSNASAQVYSLGSSSSSSSSSRPGPTPLTDENISLSLNLGTAHVDGKDVECMRYDGTPQKPAVYANDDSFLVMMAGGNLKLGEDYTVTYRNNVKPGTATAVITGKGDFTGKVELNFKIAEVEPDYHAHGVYYGDYAIMFDTAYDPPYNSATNGFMGVRVVRSDGKVTIENGLFREFAYGVDTGEWPISIQAEKGYLILFDADTETYGVARLDGTMLIPYGEYNAIVSDGLAPITATWANGKNGGVDYLSSDGSKLTSFSRSYTANVESTFIWYGNADDYPYDRLVIIYGDDKSDSIVIQKKGSRYIEVKEAPARSDADVDWEAEYKKRQEEWAKKHPEAAALYSSTKTEDGKYQENSNVNGWWRDYQYRLADSRLVLYLGKSNFNDGSFKLHVVDGKGKPISLGGYTLGVYPGEYDSINYGSGTSHPFLNALHHSVKHGNCDAWWATDRKGRWGAVDSYGNVVVPFVYDAYADRGLDNTDWALGKRNGEWEFINVKKLYAQTHSLANATAKVANQTYTGSALKPAPVVKLGGKTLKAGTDYTVSYKNNVNAGTATVTVAGKGNYTGTKSATFRIAQASIAKASVASIANQTFTGAALKPAPVVKLGGKTLKAGTDYTLSYKNNTAAGTATVTATGKGNYTGSVSRTFKIVKPAQIWHRLDGASKFDTMRKVVGEGWASGSGGTVVVATSAGYQDALCAASVAGMYQAPILLTDYNRLNSQTKAELDRIRPTNVVIVGGEYVVTPAVKKTIEGLSYVKSVRRVSGRSASDTAADVARKFFPKGKTTTAILATSQGYHDALSASPISYAKGYPIFLVDNYKTISANTLKAMRDIGITKVVIVGGKWVVDPSMESKLLRNGAKTVERYQGAKYWDTSLKVANWGITLGLSANRMGVATGIDYSDALCGAPLCGKNRSVIVLTEYNRARNTELPKAHKAKIAKAYVFGGKWVVEPKVMQEFESTTK